MSTPTFWSIARRPKWIAALALCLGIAAAFAALGQWQLERSVERPAATSEQTENEVPLAEVAEPQAPVEASAAGQLVSLEADFVAGDYSVLSDRINLGGPGYWVVGHAITTDGASLAIALGWAPDEDAAATAIRTLESTPPSPQISGRYLASESPQETDFENGRRSVLAVAELINEWTTVPEAVYGGYVILADAPAGLETIDAPEPITEVSLNLLNVFYAIEWVIFAGFAIFLWYRLVRDALEEETAENAPVE